MVSVCLPCDALLQHLPWRLTWVSLTLGVGYLFIGCSSKAQPLLLTLDKGYLLTTALPDLQCGIAPLGPPVPAQPLLFGCGVGPPSCCPGLRCGVASLGQRPCWRRLLRVPWTARKSNQSILKINPGCSLEGMMLKLKLQYFGHLM